MKKPKTPPTEAQIRESIRLRELFAERAGVSQLEFGQTYGIGNQRMVWQYLNADKPKGSALNVFAAMKFAEGLRCHVSDFSPSMQEEIDRIAVFASGLQEERVVNHIKRNKEIADEMRIKRTTSKAKKDDATANEGFDQTNESYLRYINASEAKREVVDLILLPDGADLPAWADESIKDKADSIELKALKWISGGKKASTKAA